MSTSPKFVACTPNPPNEALRLALGDNIRSEDFKGEDPMLNMTESTYD